jgi:methyl-accepting chemotaxis protein
MEMQNQKYQWKLRQVIPIGLTAIVAISFIVNTIIFLSTRFLGNTMSWVSHTNQVKSDIRLLEKVVVDAETGQRGFVITGRESFLDPYYQAIEDNQIVYENLKTTIADNPSQVRRLAEVKRLIDEKFAELNQTILLKRNGEEDDLYDLILSEEGKNLMNEIRLKLTEMERVENALLESREDEAKDAERLVQVAIFLGTIITVSLVLMIFGFIRQRVIQPLEKLSSKITGTSSEIASTISGQEQVASQQAVAVNQTTTTVNELAQASQKIAHQAEETYRGCQHMLTLTQEGHSAVDLSIQGIDVVQNNARQITEKTYELENKTSEIGTISSLVSEIAMQTNLLAFNASIEAIRAGEHGKGFGVVSTEIRKLAEQSKNSATRINTLVNEISNSINSTIHVTKEGTQKVNQAMTTVQATAFTFEKVSSSINQVVVNSQQITANIKEQDLAIQQIVEAMHSVNQGTTQTAISLNQTKVSTKILNQEAEVLIRLL